VAAAVVTLTLAAAQAGAERTVVVEPATLRDGPGAQHAPVARLAQGAQVQPGTRSRGWLRVRTMDDRGRSGWIRVWRVRTVPAAQDDDTNPILRGLQRFSRAVTGLFGDAGGPDVEQGQVTATIGVRGLKPGEFAAAEPDPEARQRLATIRAGPAEARAFAREAGLARREVGGASAGAGESRDWGEW
jgi:uncharacterized protein YgiM (DUF1202 family)